MKRLALVLLGLIFSGGAATADVLQNGNFADGLSHWYGDCRSTNVTGADATSGASVELQREWTKFTQTFDAPKGHYTVSMTFLLSPGAAFTGDEKAYRKVPAKLGFTALKEFRLKRGEFCFIVTDLAAGRYVYCAVKPQSEDSVSQTVTGTLDLPEDADQQTFCVAFPPGNGVVTVQNVSMTAK
ncbi:MAG TPA: hypothetical protein VHY09_02480 [Candidatus Methylacidiphilales bacterium]|jgi:hypothetical protein|nr:hypothetical protein [Candidatus Methylacidiphilales bacterium]